MAKKKMTLEEKLEDAIIKDKPYDVPEKWLWTKLQYVANWTSGGTPKSTHPEYYDGDIPWLIIADMNDGEIYSSNKTITEEGLINSSAKIIEEESVLIAMYGSIGKLGITKIKCSCNQAIAFTKEIMPITYNKFIYYYLMFYRDKIISRGKGGTQQNISLTVLKDVEIVIPPLEEQQRIVAKIEGLFEKLDKAKELIEEARDDFEKRKQSIIEKALMGEYVSGVKLTEVELGNILSFKNGMSKRSGKEGNETKVLRLADVSSDTIYSENARSMLLTGKEIANYKVEYGDLLIIRVNGTKKNVGKAVEYIGEDICAYCDHLIRIDCSQINKNYIKYLINSDSVRRQIDELIVSSAGQNTISQSSLNKIKTMWVEDNKVQEEIVNVINTLIDKEKSIEELTALEEQIELIKKSILAKAFRGQLGTNSEDDESALELLKEILKKE